MSNSINIYTDGSGWNGTQSMHAIHDDESDTTHLHTSNKQRTNNETEYDGLIAALEFIKNNYKYLRKDIIINMDSELVVKQMSGEYAVNNDKLKALNNTANAFLSDIQNNITIKWIPRNENKAGHFIEKIINYLKK